MAKLKYFAVILLGFIACATCQDGESPCTSPGWNFEELPCPDGYNEMYRDVDGQQQVRMCCNPNHAQYASVKNIAYTCRTVSCQPTSSSNICSSLDARFIKNGDTQLQYEEILRETCGRSDSEGVTGICCVRNSTEGLLATTMGAEPNEFPHQAKLRLPGHCGGTVYNSKFVITAAHCVVDGETKEVNEVDGMEVVLGSNIGDMTAKEYVYKVKRLIPHPQYSRLAPNPELESESPRIFNDIALLELDREIQFGPKVKSLEIAPKDFNPLKHSNKAIIVGWGTTDTLDISVHLQKANFLIRSDQSCFLNGNAGPHGDMDGMEGQLLCVGGIFEGKWSPTAGGGDSGGPAICRAANGRSLLCGVTSYGGSDEACSANNDESSCIPSVYAEVAFFHDWIKENAGEQDSSTFYQPFLYGEPITLAQHQHQVHITSEDGKPCGGTLIAPDVVITAAHCVADIDGSGSLSNVEIKTGMDTLKSPGKSYGIKSIAVLPGFKMDGEPINTPNQGNRVLITDNFYKNDLAVVKLDSATDISSDTFPQLPSRGDNTEMAMEMAFPRNTTYSAQMMQRDFRFLNKGDCQTRMNRMSRVGMKIQIDKNLLCGVEKYSGGSVCDRELGGGIICKGDDGNDVLCGVQVFRLCEFSIPNGFINMGVYSDWVKQVMSQL